MAAALPFIVMGVQAIGAISQGNAAAAQAQNQAAAARYNAEVSKQQATAALNASAAKQLAQNRQARQFFGVQRAAAAQSGVGTGGSNLDIFEQSATLSELDRLNIGYEGAMQARGFESQAAMDEYEATVFQANAKAAKRAGYMGAVMAVGGGLASRFAPTGGVSAPKSTVAGSGLQMGGGLGLRPGGGLGLRY
jgi:hypothetical protein